MTVQFRFMSEPSGYAESIDRAAIMLLAMSFRPDLKSSLIDDIATAVAIRGGRIDGHWFSKFDLTAVFDGIADRTITILSAAIRERLPEVADEMDEAFGEICANCSPRSHPCFSRFDHHQATNRAFSEFDYFFWRTHEGRCPN